MLKYKVLGEVKIKNNFREGMALRLEPYGFVLASSPLVEGDDAVIYEAIIGDIKGQKFAREKASFLEVLGKPTSQYYRFEEVE